ncbi:MAG: autotransporter-associated beta strand repeat-containing protein, partial [Kiritimatiellae bacterium]|nr:autotransporter-associated beta strand repeat-containing protein [Kiritimatiellia bacterium]
MLRKWTKVSIARILAIALINGSAHFALAATSYVSPWTGGGADASWQTVGNWTTAGSGSPKNLYISGSNIVMTGSANTVNFLGNAISIISLNFDANADTAFSIRLSRYATAGTARNLTLSGASITIDAGAGAAHTLGVVDGSVVLAANLAVTNNSTYGFTIDRPVTGAYALSKAGTGMLTLSGVNTYSAATTISGGILEIGGAGQLNSGVYAAAITNNAQLYYNSTAAQTLSGVISGTGAVVKASSGTLTLTGVNTYSGITTINGGILEIGGAGQLASGTYSQNITDSAQLYYNSTADQTLSGVISGTGAIVKANSGTLILSGNNTYSGGTTINGGILRANTTVSPNSSCGSGAVAVNAGGTLSGNGRIGGAVTVANDATAVFYPNSSSTLTLGDNLTFSGNSSGVKFDLSSSAASGNDKIVLENKTLNCGSAQITINSAGTLDSADYVLFDVG